MIDRRRRRFETLFFMTMARRDLLGSEVNVPSKRNRLKISQPDLEQIQRQLARTFLAKWIWRRPEKEEILAACSQT
jgi:hypothetical protein